MSILSEHIVATRHTYRERTGKDPGCLCLGRWDVRELARVVAPHFTPPMLPREVIAHAREGGLSVFGVPVKVDGRIGRCPGSLWWQP